MASNILPISKYQALPESYLKQEKKKKDLDKWFTMLVQDHDAESDFVSVVELHPTLL